MLTFKYKNHRGEVADRTIEVIGLDYYPKPNESFGYAPGWFLTGYDHTGDRNGSEVRSFALTHVQLPPEFFTNPSNNHPFRLDWRHDQ